MPHRCRFDRAQLLGLLARRRAGEAIAEIGATLGVSKQRAHQLLARAREALGQLVEEDRQALAEARRVLAEARKLTGEGRGPSAARPPTRRN
jgi:predicted O-methyltransferase YrrM